MENLVAHPVYDIVRTLYPASWFVIAFDRVSLFSDRMGAVVVKSCYLAALAEMVSWNENVN